MMSVSTIVLAIAAFVAQQAPSTVAPTTVPPQPANPGVTPTPGSTDAPAELATPTTPSPRPDPPKLPMEPVPSRVLPVDPVQLQSGKVVTGDPKFAELFDGNYYLFQGEDTRGIFRADPLRYAAQDGGACGRMGPLGGLGDARKYALQDGMLYFFASDDCMKAFRAEPKRYMEPQDIMPTGTPEQQEAGLAAFDRWMAYAGGKQAVRSAATYAQHSTKRVVSGGDQWDLEETIEVTGPRSMRQSQVWRKVGGTAKDTFTNDITVTPERATMSAGSGKTVELAPPRRRAFERMVNRLPYCLLRARMRPEAGFMALKMGEGKLGPYDCDYVTTWFEGNLTNLAIDKQTGRLVQEGYIGRDESAKVWMLTLDALADAGPDSLRLPTQWVTSRLREKEGTKGPALTLRVGPSLPEAPAPQPSVPTAPPAKP